MTNLVLIQWHSEFVFAALKHLIEVLLPLSGLFCCLFYLVELYLANALHPAENKEPTYCRSQHNSRNYVVKEASMVI